MDVNLLNIAAGLVVVLVVLVGYLVARLTLVRMWYARMKEENERLEKLLSQHYYTDDETKTIHLGESTQSGKGTVVLYGTDYWHYDRAEQKPLDPEIWNKWFEQ